MSLCLRTLPNKFTSLVNTRKQVTKIDRQLPKHVKSSPFLEEFLGSQSANGLNSFKEKPTSLVDYTNCQNVSDSYSEVPSQKSEISDKRCNWNQERVSRSWSHRSADTQNFRVINSNITTGSMTNDVLNNNSLWIEPVFKRNDLLTENAHESLTYCMEKISLNNMLHSSQGINDTQNQNTIIDRSTSIAQEANQKKPSKNEIGRPSEEKLQNVYDNLSKDLPLLFVKPMNYYIYTQDVEFIDNIRGNVYKGLPAYVRLIALLRMVGHLKFAYIKLDVMKITMHPEDDTIKVRWRMKGITGTKVLSMFWQFKVWKLKESLDALESWHDGFSTFYVNADGKIYKHVADKMMPDQDILEKDKSPIAKLALFAALSNLDSSHWEEICSKLNFQLPRLN